MEESPENGLQAQQVTVRYGAVTALRNVSLEVRSGELLGLVGVSGAGKTTLLQLFNGMARPASGRVRTLGRPLEDLSSREVRRLRSQVGFIHQELNLIPNLNVLQNVLAGRLGRLSAVASLRQFVAPPPSAVEEVYELLRCVGIAEKLYHRADRLSGGQRQRVAISRALFQRPRILLADEPVSSVDPGRARSVLELLSGLARERDLTLCVSLHDVELAREFFPRLAGMNKGEIVFDQATGSLEEEQFRSLFQI